MTTLEYKKEMHEDIDRVLNMIQYYYNRPEDRTIESLQYLFEVSQLLQGRLRKYYYLSKYDKYD